MIDKINIRDVLPKAAPCRKGYKFKAQDVTEDMRGIIALCKNGTYVSANHLRGKLGNIRRAGHPGRKSHVVHAPADNYDQPLNGHTSVGLLLSSDFDVGLQEEDLFLIKMKSYHRKKRKEGV